jgi:hypothetical protein
MKCVAQQPDEADSLQSPLIMVLYEADIRLESGQLIKDYTGDIYRKRRLKNTEGLNLDFSRQDFFDLSFTFSVEADADAAV